MHKQYKFMVFYIIQDVSAEESGKDSYISLLIWYQQLEQIVLRNFIGLINN